MLNSEKLSQKIKIGNQPNLRGLTIVPQPDLENIAKSGEASVSMRLGRWFLVLKQTSKPYFDVTSDELELRRERSSARKYFVPFGKEFILHPGRFVLASTLEWMRFPVDLGGYVTGKSTWARRGLIIETAAGIHPGFSGCLTLEMANVGEVPIVIRPGMYICQLFVHAVPNGKIASQGPLSGQRRPYLGKPRNDEILQMLQDSSR
jgi:dCTP deaminase